MKVWTGDPRKWGPGPDRGTAVTIGVFDGVHQGHRGLLGVMSDLALALGGVERAVVTFDVHPRSVVAPDRAPKMLTTVEQRLEIFESLGVDQAGVLPFDLVRSWPPDEFVRRVVVDGLAARLVAVGAGFRYGAGRRGDAPALRRAGEEYGFEVEELGLLAGEEGPISSSAIRRFIAEGDVAAAGRLLDRRHGLQVRVPESGRCGAWSDSPVVEVEVDRSMAVPGPGVYAVWAAPEGDEDPCPGLCSIGAEVELYAPDRIGGLHGQEIRVLFVDRLREDPSFGGPTRLEQDMALARRLLA